MSKSHLGGLGIDLLLVFRLNPCGITGAGRVGVNDPLARGAGTGVETGVGEGVGIEDVDEMLSFID